MHTRLQQGVDHLLGVETRQEPESAAGQQRHVGGDEEPMGVEDRQGVEQRVDAGEAPQRRQGGGIGTEILVGQHRSLGAAGGSRGVEQGREIVGLPRHRGKMR